MIERKCINANIADNGVDVVFEAADVVPDRFLYAHMIWIIAGKVALCPSLTQFANGGHFGIRSATLTNEVDIAEDLLEGPRIGGACRGIEVRAGDIKASRLAKFVGDFGEGSGAGVGLGFGLARRKGDSRTIG
ncbi:MAG: hypothetical protein IPM54_00185 [Polyangiaceae bacterium]|nr:hypothetical protein [Polyangiaceae bacterium]